jgi:fructan beta-fructosidase
MADPAAARRRRPQVHFTAERTWLNDPNGLIHHEGLWHLYWQGNPHGADWAHMSWGHATSPDLVSWTEHPVAIEATDEEDVFSGSVVHDRRNTSGLGAPGRPALVALYTSAYRPGGERDGRQAQSVAYSLDEGRTWVRHPGNPVLDRGSREFRDPKVFWHATEDGGEGGYWVMVAVEAVERMVVLYRSEDLLTWRHLSSFGPANAVGGVWECPDLFPLALDGDPATTLWVLAVSLNPGGVNGGSATQYFVGEFDGTTFTSHTTVEEGLPGTTDLRELDWLDWGGDYYAAVSFGDAPAGRRVMVGWMSNWDYAPQTPTSPWRGVMSAPRDLSLVTVQGRPRVAQALSPEVLERCGRPVLQLRDEVLTAGQEVTGSAAAGEAFLIELQVSLPSGGRALLVVTSAGEPVLEISLDPLRGELVVERSGRGAQAFHPGFPSTAWAPLVVDGETVALTAVVDRCSVELFACDGLVTSTHLVFAEGCLGLSLSGSSDVLVRHLRMSPLAPGA